MSAEYQEGIYFREGEAPGKYFGICFLETMEGATGPLIERCLVELWKLITELKNGNIPELPGHSVPSGSLTSLIGYGPNCFKASGTKQMPDGLKPKNRFLSPRTSGGGPLLIGSGTALCG